MVYSPPGKDWFCAEPVSNTSDAFNLNATYDPTQVVDSRWSRGNRSPR